MTISLTLDVRTPDGGRLPNGGLVTVRYDRTVRMTDGTVPALAQDSFVIAGDVDPVMTVPYANDDAAVADDSQGFGIIINARWRDGTALQTWSKTVAIDSSYGSAVSLSALPDAQPVPPQYMTVTAALAAANQAVSDAQAAETSAASSASSAAASAALVGAPADTAVKTLFSSPSTATRVETDGLYAVYAVKSKVPARAYTPEQFGAVGDGTADDTTAVLNCFAAANGVARPGIVSTIIHPGATVELNGTYNLASISAPVDVRCNVRSTGATFMIPAAYAGVAVRVGDERASGNYLQSAKVQLPDIVKPTGSVTVAGSVGCRITNFGNSELSFGRILYFAVAQHYTGWGQGAVYLDVFPGYIAYCPVAFKIMPDLAGGWANQIFFRSGSVQQSSSYAGGSRLSTWAHVQISGNNINNVDEITFDGTSFEGDVSQSWATVAQAKNITFTGCRHEQGITGTPATFTASSSSVTIPSHGLVVGDMITFTASTAPGGLLTSSPYFVVSVIDANTVTISQNQGGGAVTFTSAGSTALAYRPPRITLDSSVTLTNLQIQHPYTLLGVMEVVDASANGSGIGVQQPDQRRIDAYRPDDLPLYMARNRSSSSSRPAFAAYPPSVKPWVNPRGWSTAIGDRGLIFAANGAETGCLTNSGGVLTWTRAGASAVQIGSMNRSGGLTSTAGLSCSANAATTFTIAVSGAAVNDYALGNVVDPLPAGIVLAQTRVSAAGTVEFRFYNYTGSAIALTVNVEACVVSRFF